MKILDKSYEDFSIGDYVTFEKIFTLRDFKLFSEISEDSNPLHYDEQYAKDTELGSIIVPMHLVASPLSAIAGMMIPGHRSLYLNTKLRSILPTPYEKAIIYTAKIVEKQDVNNVLVLKVLALSDKSVVLDADMTVQVRSNNDGYVQELYLKNYRYGNIKSERNVFITGASGAIGREVAKQMAKKGFNLILHYNNESDKFDNCVKECKLCGVDVYTIKSDISNKVSLDSMVKEINALPFEKKVSDIIHTASPPINDKLERLVKINFASLKFIFDNLLESLLIRQNGSVTLLGSSALQFNPKGWENYIAAKVSAVQYINGIHKEYSKYGINSRTFSPGVVLTDFSKELHSSVQQPMLPEQIGEIIATGVDGGWGSGDQYIWMESNITKVGSFGFKLGDSNQALKKPSNKKGVEVDDDHSNRSISDLDNLVTSFFKMDKNIEILETGVDLYPGWDSLSHIELILEIESFFNIKLEADDIENTKTYKDLNNLVYRKIKNKK